ncbi:MAG: hypothetical protein ACYTG3_07945 [Planctomycetota bacterium]|jgi:hypothetical protein
MHGRLTRSVLVLVLALAACTSTAPADPWPLHSALSDPVVSAEGEVRVEGEPGGKAEHESKVGSHVVSLFVGGSSERGDGGGFTIGAEYAYRFRPKWSVGAFGEYTAGDLDAVALGAAVFFFPIEPLALMAGPGVELVDGKAEALARVGAAYEFEVGEVILAPGVYVDFVNGGTQVIVAGLNIGKRF